MPIQLYKSYKKYKWTYWYTSSKQKCIFHILSIWHLFCVFCWDILGCVVSCVSFLSVCMFLSSLHFNVFFWYSSSIIITCLSYEKISRVCLSLVLYVHGRLLINKTISMLIFWCTLKIREGLPISIKSWDLN